MGRQRNTTSPTKAKANMNALESNPPPEIFHRRLELRRRLSVTLLVLLTVVLLSVSFAPFNCWYLAYVALVPWVLALDAGTSRRWALLWGWLGGVVFWAANLYWLWWITLVGYAALVIYLSVFWFVSAIIVRAAARRSWPLWIVLPVVWVALEYARAYIISGFPWFYLAHSQYDQTHLIQVADMTGQYGVSFFVAMVNGAIVDLVASPLFVRSKTGPRLGRNTIAGAIAAIFATCGLLGYGTWRLGQQTHRPGPVIGIVQEAFPISLTGRSDTPEKIFHEHLQSSSVFVGKGCDLVIWPETMLPKGLNPQILELNPNTLDHADLRSLAERIFGPIPQGYSDERLRVALESSIKGQTSLSDERWHSKLTQAKKIEVLSRRLGCPILAGG
ncbi:MAG: hypothetical protein KAU28_05335, partial [Phycisphaerae bacterium]|nr:hypothetical protein [Phycisphaerae bacterium]